MNSNPKIVLVTLGSRGDVFPYISLGAALGQLGADCYLCTGMGFAEDAAVHGLTPLTLSVDFRPLLSPEFIKSTRSLRGIYRTWKKTRGFQAQLLNSLWDEIREIEPDLIVYHHNKGAAALYIAEALNIPAMATSLIPAYVPTRAFRNPFVGFAKNSAELRRYVSHLIILVMNFALKKSVKRWCRESLALVASTVQNTFDGYHPEGKQLPRIHLFSEAILPKPHDWLARDIVSGYCYVDCDEAWTPPKKLQDFLSGGPPPIYIGFGSMPIAQIESLRDIVVNALSISGHRGLLMTGQSQTQNLGLPETIIAIGNIPHDWLFPQCAVIVHHGGIGTVHQVLRWGKPSIICPMFLDQPFWGEIVHAFDGSPKPQKFKNLSANILAKNIETALTLACTNAAEAVGQKMQDENGADHAAQIIMAQIPT